MSENFDYSAVDEILSAHASDKAAVIAVLQDIQEHYRYLPKEIFPYLSQKLGIRPGTVKSRASRGKKMIHENLRRKKNGSE